MLEADTALATWLSGIVDGQLHYRQAPLNTKPPYYEYWVTNEVPSTMRGFGEDVREITHTVVAVSLDSVDAAERFAVIADAFMDKGEQPKVEGWSVIKPWTWTGRYDDDYDVEVDGDPIYREGAMYEVILRRL